MSRFVFSSIYFIYGLAFFSMGLAVTLEMGRGTDERLRWALRPLAVFGILHGSHEWIEMFELIDALPGLEQAPVFWSSIRLAFLALSFLSLATFGPALLPDSLHGRRLVLLIPFLLVAIWSFGILTIGNQGYAQADLWSAADVWTRYVLAIPSALLAAVGLVAQQRTFRRAGLARFGQDSLWAAVAFAWYGAVGQIFTRSSPLWLSRYLNQDLFLEMFGFPVQLLRAAAAVAVAFFVIRFLRSSEVEIQRQIRELQEERLEDAERREAMRGEMLKRIVAAQEAERQRIGRELHDETGQALTAIGLGLRGISKVLEEKPKRAESNLRQLENLVSVSLNELQRLISDLRPSHLDDLGLASALRWYAGEVEKRVDIDIKVEILGESPKLASAVKTGLFRVAQEAITNVVKHADAYGIKVKLEYKRDCVSLEVQDDGQGFDPAIVAMDSARPAWGIAGMQERANLLGGTFHLTTLVGEGTRVLVTIPYQGQNETDDENTIDVS